MLVPLALWEAYGQPSLLRRHYPGGTGLGRLRGRPAGSGPDLERRRPAGRLARPGRAARPAGREASTAADYVASAYLAHSAALVGRAAAALADDDAAAGYARLSAEVAAATWRKWAAHAVSTQTGCALALAFGIAPEPERAEVGATLAGLVRRAGGRIGTGFLGTPYLLPALTGTGHLAEAYQLLLNEDCPGWLYQVARGATTTWERWDAIRPDGTVNDGELTDGTMTSFNHYAYGVVADWLHRTVAGLAPAAPGYREILIAPHPGGGLSHATSTIDTPYGRASAGWTLDATTLRVTVTVPPGSTARLRPPPAWAPTEPVGTRGSGEHHLELRPASGPGPATAS